MRKLILLVLVLAVGSAASAAIITAVERTGGSTNDAPVIASTTLGEDALCFVDRTHEYNDIPVELLGAEYVMTPNNDKKAGDYGLNVTLSQPAMLGLIIDNRVGNDDLADPPDDYAGITPNLSEKMTWVTSMGFVDTGLDIGIDESGTGTIDKWSSVYSMTVGAGVISLGAQDDGGSRNMYGVGAVPEPTTIALLGMGGLALLRRRRK